MSAKRTLITNFFSLSSFQFVNYVLPLITVPYVVRIMGPSNYGLVNFASAFVGYFALLVNYGFDLSATREIARYRDNIVKTNEIFNSVLFAKLNLFVAGTMVFGVCLLTVAKFREEWLLFMYVYIGLVGATFFPTWLFQGMERLSLTATFNFIIRLLFTFSIFIFIKKRSDYLLYALISSLGVVVGGICAFAYALKQFNLDLKLPSMTDLKNAYRNGWLLFTSTVVINFYTTSNTVILGFFADSINVGFYSGAMKFITVAQALLTMPLNQSLYPHIATSFREGYETGINKLKKAVIVVGAFTLVASIGIFFFSDAAIRIILGREFLPAVTTLRLLAFIPFIIGLSNVFGIQGLLNLHKDPIFFKVTSIGAMLNLILNFLFTPVLLQNGTAISWLITEIFITASMYIALLREKVNLFDVGFIKRYLFQRA